MGCAREVKAQASGGELSMQRTEAAKEDEALGERGGGRRKVGRQVLALSVCLQRCFSQVGELA